MCVVLLITDSFMLCYFCVICVFCLLVVLVRLSVPVQVIGFVSEMTYNVLMGTLNPTHSLTPQNFPPVAGIQRIAFTDCISFFSDF